MFFVCRNEQSESQVDVHSTGIPLTERFSFLNNHPLRPNTATRRLVRGFQVDVCSLDSRSGVTRPEVPMETDNVTEQVEKLKSAMNTERTIKEAQIDELRYHLTRLALKVNERRRTYRRNGNLRFGNSHHAAHRRDYLGLIRPRKFPFEQRRRFKNRGQFEQQRVRVEHRICRRFERPGCHVEQRERHFLQREGNFEQRRDHFLQRGGHFNNRESAKQTPVSRRRPISRTPPPSPQRHYKRKCWKVDPCAKPKTVQDLDDDLDKYMSQKESTVDAALDKEVEDIMSSPNYPGNNSLIPISPIETPNLEGSDVEMEDEDLYLNAND